MPVIERVAIETYEVPIEKANRAVTDEEEEGFVRIHVRRGSDEIVGATIVSTHAGELIGLITLDRSSSLPSKAHLAVTWKS